ncbi:hypothetical protein Tco_1366942 [Tanacetum coccineum]
MRRSRLMQIISKSCLALIQESDYRRKCEAAERAYNAKREKELAMMQCRELEFLMLDPSSLPPAKRAIIEKKQAEIMRKYPDAKCTCRGPDVCDTRTSYVSRQHTSSDGDNAAPCLLRRLATPDWLHLTFWGD